MMNIDKAVMISAGVVNLVGILFSLVSSPAWLLLSAIVSVMLIQAPFTGFCPMAMIYKKIGLEPGKAFFCEGDGCCCKK